MFLLTHWLPITSILFRIVRIFRSLFICNYLKNKNFSLGFLFHLWNLHQILNIFKKKKIVRANVFLKLQTLKDFFRQLSKKSRFRTSFASTQVKGSQTLVKSTWEHFYYTFSSIWGKVIWKKWKVIWIINQILKIFQKKEIVIANVFPKLQTVKGLGRPLSKKCRFRISFDSQHVKGSRRFVKPAWEHFYHILPSLGGDRFWNCLP